MTYPAGHFAFFPTITFTALPFMHLICGNLEEALPCCDGVGVGVELEVGVGVGLGVELEVGVGVGLGIGVGVELEVGVGVGVASAVLETLWSNFTEIIGFEK